MTVILSVSVIISQIQDVPVFVLENEIASATITPQWGGKVWDFRLKANADRGEVPLVFNNPIHQSVNSGVLKVRLQPIFYFLMQSIYLVRHTRSRTNSISFIHQSVNSGVLKVRLLSSVCFRCDSLSA